ncbi:protein WVD2-like 7 isoform X1 [Triticum urartu]|uniref:TPX2 C-terminal domain-containing protein n=1 Tax=Triticum urartu TaxID=4572 RepID=A0A8R7TCT0_TRIUA|nr:protein WVD2-like 7 isoform X1 [Triticum urartu]
MGAAPGQPPSPPPPERTASPERGALRGDDRDWKAEMMSALGESVSFGRFLSEPLEWGRWSAFEHNRYLEEAAGQSRPGSVAQKKAFFEEHYARKRKSADVDEGRDADADGGEAWSADSSCMTDEPAGEETGGVDSGAPEDCGAVVDAAVPGEAHQELKAVADGVVSSCRLDSTAERSHELRDVQVAEARKGLQLDAGCVVAAVDAVEKQPLQESSIVNQGVADTVEKKRHPMSSLFQKPAEFSSPPSGKKAPSSSAKRRSTLRPAKENSSPFPSTDSNKQEETSVAQKGSILGTMNFRRCEIGDTASRSRNLGSTIASRISQLESASRPVKDVHPKVNKQRRTSKGFCKGIPEAASTATQQPEQRSPYVSVTRVKEMLFGSTSPPTHPETNIAKENMGKANDGPELKEIHQSVRFKARSLPNFYWRSKESKDSRQGARETHQNPPNSDHRLNDDASDPHGMSRGASKDKQICCFPLIRR